MNATAALASEILDAALDRLESDPSVATRLRAIMSGQAATYSQDDLPPHMSKRAYLDHCTRGDWPNRKVGRLRITLKSDFDAWTNSRATQKRPPAAAESSGGVVDHEAYLLALGARPSKRRGR